MGSRMKIKLRLDGPTYRGHTFGVELFLVLQRDAHSSPWLPTARCPGQGPKVFTELLTDLIKVSAPSSTPFLSSLAASQMLRIQQEAMRPLGMVEPQKEKARVCELLCGRELPTDQEHQLGLDTNEN